MIKRRDYRLLHKDADNKESSSSDSDSGESEAEGSELEWPALGNSSDSGEDSAEEEEEEEEGPSTGVDEEASSSHSEDDDDDEEEDDEEREDDGRVGGPDEEIPADWLKARGLVGVKSKDRATGLERLKASGHRDWERVRSQWVEVVEEEEGEREIRKKRKLARRDEDDDEEEDDEEGEDEDENEESDEEGEGEGRGGGGGDRGGKGGRGADILKELLEKGGVDDEKMVVQVKGVVKCVLCPSVVCLSAESMQAHLKSKRHRRSEKKLAAGTLTRWLNSDGEEEEAAETHAERHARITALQEGINGAKSQKRKALRGGRQRQRKRLRLKQGDGEPPQAEGKPEGKKDKAKSPKNMGRALGAKTEMAPRNGSQTKAKGDKVLKRRPQKKGKKASLNGT